MDHFLTPISSFYFKNEGSWSDFMFFSKFTCFIWVTMETRPETDVVVKIDNHNIHFLKLEIPIFP